MYATTDSCCRQGKANQTRLKTASELQRRELGESAFGRSLVRHALYAVWRAAQSGDTATQPHVASHRSGGTTGDTARITRHRAPLPRTA